MQKVQKFIISEINSYHLGEPLLPKAGFKSITVSENIYNKFYTDYKKIKKDLAMKGITSFSGYIVSILAEKLEDSNE